MKITFTITNRETLAILAYTLPRNFFLVISQLGVLAFVSYQDVILNIPANEPLSSQISYVVIHEGLLALCFLGAWFLFFLFVILARKRTTVDAGRTIELGEEGFVVESPSEKFALVRLECRWEMVKKLVRTGSHIILNTRSGIFIIPRRAFDSESQWDEFHGFCRRKSGGSAPSP